MKERAKRVKIGDTRKIQIVFLLFFFVIISIHAVLIIRFERYTKLYPPMVNQVNQIKQTIAASHLWLEENLWIEMSGSGANLDAKEDIAFDSVILEIEKSKKILQDIGEWYKSATHSCEMFDSAFMNASGELELFLEKSVERYKQKTNSENDHAYDKLYAELLGSLDMLSGHIQEAAKESHNEYSNILYIANIVEVFYFFIAFFTIYSIGRKRDELQKNLEINNEQLEKRIKERTAELEEIQKGLMESEERAQRANVSKSEYLASMSHEIRTPMNGIIGMGTLALKKIDQNPEESKNFMKKSISSAKTLLGIINDILDISKIEAGKLEVEKIPFNIRKLMLEIDDLFAYSAESKELYFKMNIDRNVPNVIFGDPLRIKQIVNNFISNAIKFTEQGGIEVNVKALKKHENDFELYISVKDSGKGISKDLQERIFEPFSQEDKTISRKFGGSGLGLSICKRLTTLMGGSIGVESQEREGSCFWFQIPTVGVYIDDLLEKFEKERVEVEEFKSRDTHLLLVEDDEINQEIAHELLSEVTANIDIAPNGQVALDMIFAREPDYYDLVLMDINMPVMSGFDATKAIREREEYKSLQIFALSANAMREDKIKSMELGIDGYITKPFDALELQQIVREALKRSYEARGKQNG